MDKLTTYASLVGVVTAIGGGFYAWYFPERNEESNLVKLD